MPYIVPFAVFVGLRAIPLSSEWLAPARFLLVAVTLAIFSRQVISWRPSFPVASIVLGAAVLAIWIAPDLLWPVYRGSWLFQNSLTGVARSTVPTTLHANVPFIAMRILESAILVPILEELFWRGWLMRWIIRSKFQTVPIGQFTLLSFSAVALLFASEHGPYWDVGLLAGIAYNAWCVRTRNLADCIIAHAVTNALLAAYILIFKQWQYWL